MKVLLQSGQICAKFLLVNVFLGGEEELHLLNGGGHQMRLLWDNSNPLVDHFGNLFASYLNILYETGYIFPVFGNGAIEYKSNPGFQKVQAKNGYFLAPSLYWGV